jgi:hypothetical protein
MLQASAPFVDRRSRGHEGPQGRPTVVAAAGQHLYGSPAPGGGVLCTAARISKLQ